MSAGPQYMVRQFGRRKGDGGVELLLTVPEGRQSENLLIDRVSTLKVLTGVLRVRLSEMRGWELVTRTVTGHDIVIDDGLLTGAAFQFKDLYPTRVDAQTEWEDLA